MQSTGTAGSASGRWVSALAVLVALVPTWFLVRRARVRWWLMLVAVIVLVAAGLGLGRLAGPSLARMSSVGSSLPMAAGAQLLTTSSSERTWCAGGVLEGHVRVRGAGLRRGDVEVAQALVAEGWAPGEPGRFCRDGLGVNVTPDDGPDVDRAPEVPSGTALLSMTTSVCDG